MPDLLGLGERTNGSGGKLGEVEVLLLSLTTNSKWRLSGEHPLGDTSNTVTDGRVGSVLEFTSSSNVLDVLLKEGRLFAVESASKSSNLFTFLLGKREPAQLLSSQLGLDLDGDGAVEKGRRGGDDDTVGTEGSNGLFGQSLGSLEVCFPDVSTRNDTEFNVDLGVLEGSKDRVELLWLTVKVEVESVNRERLEEVDALANPAVSGGDGDLGGDRSKSLVDLLVLGSPRLSLVHHKDGLVNLNLFNASLLELGEELFVDGEEVVEEREGLKVGRCLTGLGDEGKVGDGTEENWSGGDTEGFGLLVLDKLLVEEELEGGGGRMGDLDDVVVGIKAGRSAMHKMDRTHNFPISQATTSTPFALSCRPRPMAAEH